MNTIPPITDPLGAHWEQPNPKNILVDDMHALMTQADFERLKEYSTSIPTALYTGKMWKMKHFGMWFLRWCVEDDVGPCIHARGILLV